MATKSKARAKAQTKMRVKVGKLKPNQNSLIELTPLQKKNLRGSKAGKKGGGGGGTKKPAHL